MVNTDPFAILGIPPDADDKAVREAYFRKVRLHPPDRDPAGFQAIRKAYERISDEDARIGFRLFWSNPPRGIADLATEFPADRVPVGPEPWLKLIALASKK